MLEKYVPLFRRSLALRREGLVDSGVHPAVAFRLPCLACRDQALDQGIKLIVRDSRYLLDRGAGLPPLDLPSRALMAKRSDLLGYERHG